MARASNLTYFNKLSGQFSIHVARYGDTMSSELEKQCEQSEWELEYDDGPSTFSYSCMSSGSVSDSNHLTDVPSLLSRLNNNLILFKRDNPVGFIYLSCVLPVRLIIF